MKKLFMLLPLLSLLFSCDFSVLEPPAHVLARNNSVSEVLQFCANKEGQCVIDKDFIIFIDEGFLFALLPDRKEYLKNSYVKKIAKYKNGLLILKEYGTFILAINPLDHQVINDIEECSVVDFNVMGNNIVAKTFNNGFCYYNGTVHKVRTEYGFRTKILTDSEYLGSEYEGTKIYLRSE